MDRIALFGAGAVVGWGMCKYYNKSDESHKKIVAITDLVRELSNLEQNLSDTNPYMKMKQECNQNHDSKEVTTDDHTTPESSHDPGMYTTNLYHGNTNAPNEPEEETDSPSLESETKAVSLELTL